jgi:c-di-GMP-binding flagellar brake protein YcgR
LSKETLNEQGQLKINLPVKIARSNEKTFYSSTVQDIGDDFVTIMAPLQEGYPFLPQPGEAILGRFIQDRKSFYFYTFVLGKQKENGIILLELSMPEEIKEDQQRTSVRLPILLDIEKYKLSAVEEGQEPVYEKGKALDLSAGGMKITSSLEYPIGTIFSVRFSLEFSESGINQSVHFLTRALLAYCKEIEKHKLYHIGVEFIDLKEPQKDKIFKFIFNKMSKRMV